ncbi:hypothetical protein GHT09_006001 [Marmota monax]|uniref:Uncharacterized protein n=1 Tax=Marmota monax TaxID=9995 RepID=A0A834QQJ1_MARMO|nr:hypothetical protein GHT09_006001 [Marmota monax]
MTESESISTGAMNVLQWCGQQVWALPNLLSGNASSPSGSAQSYLIVQVLCGSSSPIAAIFVAILTLVPHLVCGSKQITGSLVDKHCPVSLLSPQTYLHRDPSILDGLHLLLTFGTFLAIIVPHSVSQKTI